MRWLVCLFFVASTVSALPTNVDKSGSKSKIGVSKFPNHNNPTFDFYMLDKADGISRRQYPPPFDSNHFDFYSNQHS